MKIRCFPRRLHVFVAVFCLFILPAISEAVSRGRPIIVNGNLRADNGTPLRGPAIWFSLAMKNRMPVIETEWRNYFRDLSEVYHMNAVRLCWAYVQDKTLDPATEAQWVDKFVQWAEEDGIYLMLNFHDIGTTNQQKALDFWAYYAPRYKDKTHVIYEANNEPKMWGSDFSSTLIAFQTQLYTNIRALAPNTHIVLWSPSSISNGSSFITAQLNVATGINYSNASVGFHGYGNPSASLLNQIRSAGYPILCTEFDSKNESTKMTNWTNTMAGIGLYEGSGTSWFTWSPSGTPLTSVTPTQLDPFTSEFISQLATAGIAFWPKDNNPNGSPAAPTITTPPQSQTVNSGANVSFSVVANTNGGGTLSYQWKRGATNVGANSPSLSLTNVSSADAGNYTVVVTNSIGNVTSTAATLTVNVAGPVSFSAHPTPTSQTVNTGAQVNYSVSATGNGNLSFQWKRGSTNVGTNSSTFSIASATTADSGNYTCVVTNTVGNTSQNLTSNAASLTVNAATVQTPQFSAHPISATVNLGTNVTLRVAASVTDGGTLSYVWKRDTTTVGTNSPTLNLNNVSSTDAGSYTCIVTNTLGAGTASATSNPGVLTVRAAVSSVGLSTAAVGSATGSSGVNASDTSVNLIGTGTGFSATGDSIYFLKKSANPTGDFQTWVQLSSLTGGTKAGLMLRETNDATTNPVNTARFVEIGFAPNTNIATYSSRQTTGSGAITVGTVTAPSTPAKWMLLERINNQVTVAVSNNNTAYTTLQTITLPGLANALSLGIYGHGGTATTATFDSPGAVNPPQVVNYLLADNFQQSPAEMVTATSSFPTGYLLSGTLDTAAFSLDPNITNPSRLRVAHSDTTKSIRGVNGNLATFGDIELNVDLTVSSTDMPTTGTSCSNAQLLARNSKSHVYYGLILERPGSAITGTGTTGYRWRLVKRTSASGYPITTLKQGAVDAITNLPTAPASTGTTYQLRWVVKNVPNGPNTDVSLTVYVNGSVSPTLQATDPNPGSTYTGASYLGLTGFLTVYYLDNLVVEPAP